MELKMKWARPINLEDGAAQNLIYVAKGLDTWRDVPGVYFFARKFGGSTIPLYIGKGESLGDRAWQHFKTNTKLMMGIRDAANGNRVLILGEFSAKQGQNTKKCIALVERALIRHALAEGYELLNVQGARTPMHSIKFAGNREALSVTGKRLWFKD